jgi:nucleoside-diphosphate-sugar epimerase
MRVLVTGHLGYIGMVLTPMLLNAGHEVIGYDSDLFERCTYPGGGEISKVPFIRNDVRDVEPGDFKGVDAVLHLAALSNDSLGDFNPETPSVRIAGLAKQAGTKRFLFASSCSNYGRSGELMIDETGALFRPLRMGRSSGKARISMLRLPPDSRRTRPARGTIW